MFLSPPVVIAVVSWNTCDLLNRCLASLCPESDSGRAEVWVVDNGSSDGSVEMVASAHPWVRLLVPEENLGFGSAVNEVARRTKSDWIVASNADVELESGALDALLAAAEAPDVGSVAPRLITLDGETQHSVHSFPTPSLAALHLLGAHRLPGLGERLLIEGFWDVEKPRDVDWAHGALLLIRRRAFDECGGFDAAQWMYAEDIDIQWRLAEHGWRRRYEPRSRVRHAVSAATVQAFGDERLGRHLSATYAWQARRQGLARTWVSAVLNAAGSLVRALLTMPLSRAAPERWGSVPGAYLTYARVHLKGIRTAKALDRATARPS